MGAVLVLLIVPSHIHSSSQSENFLGQDAFAHSGHKLVTIKAYRLTFELDRAHRDVELRVPHVENLGNVHTINRLRPELLLQIHGILDLVAAGLLEIGPVLLLSNLMALRDSEDSFLRVEDIKSVLNGGQANLLYHMIEVKVDNSCICRLIDFFDLNFEIILVRVRTTWQ